MADDEKTPDAKTLIETATKAFVSEIPALANMKLVVGVDLRGRGDLQQYRLEMPAVKVTKDIGADARVRIEMRREFFNEMVRHKAKLADWREAFTYGQARATGTTQILQLVERVIGMHEDRARAQKARPHHPPPA
jgi:hypothetical protein